MQAVSPISSGSFSLTVDKVDPVSEVARVSHDLLSEMSLDRSRNTICKLPLQEFAANPHLTQIRLLLHWKLVCLEYVTNLPTSLFRVFFWYLRFLEYGTLPGTFEGGTSFSCRIEKMWFLICRF